MSENKPELPIKPEQISEIYIRKICKEYVIEIRGYVRTKCHRYVSKLDEDEELYLNLILDDIIKNRDNRIEWNEVEPIRNMKSFPNLVELRNAELNSKQVKKP